MAVMPKGRTPHEVVSDRFVIAQDAGATGGERDLQWDLREAFVALARTINETVADSREKSLALTHLEEALMWTGKAIFKRE